ncbi:MAG: pantoate--beta-alanine ligase [Planctomycetota bacterium]|jgi:pantoate--beta-alanine ligase|nr:pantoate--beta-alanine ligase [Planctomycetota bacterium]
MRIVDDPKDLSAPDLCGCGFVPTMGALHEGHGSLVRRASADGRPIVVSIFVNPTQFGPSEDYARYPRTLDSDCALLEPLGVAAVFVPSVEAIYPRGLEAARTEAAATQLPEVATRPQLEDACRPTHFGGVALVVGRLFDLVRPGRAYFGEKDYQQLRLIEDMVAADRGRYGSLEIVPCPTIRERDGLAMSSRNRYLAPEHRDAALALSRALQIAHSAQRVATAERLMRDTLDAHGLETEYAVVRDARTLMPVTGFERPTRALIAVRLGSTRLIDNAQMTVWR